MHTFRVKYRLDKHGHKLHSEKHVILCIKCVVLKECRFNCLPMLGVYVYKYTYTLNIGKQLYIV